MHEPVYNIEVEGDHVYRVGESGVLVHNNSIDPCCPHTWNRGHVRNNEEVIWGGVQQDRYDLETMELWYDSTLADHEVDLAADYRDEHNGWVEFELGHRNVGVLRISSSRENNANVYRRVRTNRFGDHTEIIFRDELRQPTWQNIGINGQHKIIAFFTERQPCGDDCRRAIAELYNRSCNTFPVYYVVDPGVNAGDNLRSFYGYRGRI